MPYVILTLLVILAGSIGAAVYNIIMTLGYLVRFTMSKLHLKDEDAKVWSDLYDHGASCTSGWVAISLTTGILFTLLWKNHVSHTAALF